MGVVRHVEPCGEQFFFGDHYLPFVLRDLFFEDQIIFLQNPVYGSQGGIRSALFPIVVAVSAKVIAELFIRSTMDDTATFQTSYFFHKVKISGFKNRKFTLKQF